MVPVNEASPAGGRGTWTQTHPARVLANWLGVARRRKESLLALGALAFAFWILARRLVLAPIGFDETYFLWTGWSLNHGLVPYRDFVEYKPVMIFVLNGLGLKLFGLDFYRFRYVFAILSGASFLMLATALMRRGVGSLLTFCVVTAMIYALFTPPLHDLTINDAETVGMSFLLLGIACFMWGGPRADAANLCGGACLTLAVLSKEPFAFIALTTWGTLGFWSRATFGLSWRRFASRSCAGAAVVLGVVVGYLILTGALSFYFAGIREYFGYTQRIGCSKPASLVELVRVAWGQINRVLLTPAILGGLVPFMLAFGLADRTGWGARIGIVLAVVAGVHAVSLGGCYFRHYFLMGFAGFFLWAVLGASALGDWLTRVRGGAPLAIGIGLVVLACVAFQAEARFRSELATTYRPARVDFMHTSPALVDFINRNTAPTDYVFSDGMPGIFLLTNRQRPTRESGFLDEFIDSYPGRNDVERLSKVRGELVAHKPKVIYLDPGYASRKRRTRAALIMPFIREFGYQPVMANVYFRAG